VRAAEHQHIHAAAALRWLHQAEAAGLVLPTGDRLHSINALRGARLYRLADS
jgi:hypothetical protein